ncbi:YesL family protein [Saccharococcus caldoxylosilyticus]|uniref:YesL family protein n=1 Tax=Saccharococcus caldoxylosilyticus TaxID=81408 RepID=UPI001FCBC95B|nr:DUF624 domain-containing protein [Parageobacillus caldoxylosilyticus]BDG36083.1 hypothetical protein PcaKH15_19890 [Parageobacillus caldoxylosilyticus]BDG39866.1 hypothetical protein PcaKH16_20050 [Parageobacillus caldoxylosilyticus]
MAGNVWEKMMFIFEWITRFSIVNLLWLFFNAPIVYLVALLLLADNISQIITLFVTIFALSPIFIFPATSAMFGVVRKWVIGEDEIPLLRTYWKYYKENYVKSMIGGFVVAFLSLILAADFYYFSHRIPIMSGMCLVALAFLFVFALIFFCNTVHIDAKLYVCLKNSLFLLIATPIHALAIFIVSIIILYISLEVFSFMIVLFMGTSIAYVSFFGYYKMFTKVKRIREEKRN